MANKRITNNDYALHRFGDTYKELSPQRKQDVRTQVKALNKGIKALRKQESLMDKIAKRSKF